MAMKPDRDELEDLSAINAATPCEGGDDLCGAPAGQSCDLWCPSWDVVRVAVPCEGADDLCGAPAGQSCEPWCPSWAADPV